MAAIAPMVSIWHSENAMLADFHISCTGVETSAGRPCPPNSIDAGMACQPLSQKALNASLTPCGVVTTPSLQTQPVLSPGWLSGASTSLANLLGFFENGLDQIVGHFLIARQSGDMGEVSDFPHGEKHIANGRLIGGHDGLR